MISNWQLRSTTFGLGLLLIALPGRLAAQSAGGIEFTAQVTPTDGRPEPVRQLTFCLLSKSLQDVRQEALQLEPAPDLDKFVDGLTVSPELKAWMKKNHTVRLLGADFAKGLTPDDVVNVPEFFDAYMLRNKGFQGVGFPNPKFNEKDRASNPEKYNQQKREYKEAIRKFVALVPQSVEGIDTDLTAINPSAKWEQLLDVQRRRLEERTLELAHTRYLVAQTDTNLNGQGWFGGLAPGAYWIGLVGMQAVSGDVRLRWDFPVAVRAGETTHVELTNFNAAKPYSWAQNSNP